MKLRATATARDRFEVHALKRKRSWWLVLGILVLIAAIMGSIEWWGARAAHLPLWGILTIYATMKWGYPIVDWWRHRARTRRCEDCGTPDSMRPCGVRRGGYIRLRCTQCGAKKTATLPE